MDLAIIPTSVIDARIDAWDVLCSDYTLLLLVHSRLLSYPTGTITTMVKKFCSSLLRLLVTDPTYNTLIPDLTPLIAEHNSRINS